MRLIVREHVNNIAEPIEKVYQITVDDLHPYGTISPELGLERGDILVCSGRNEWSRLPAGKQGQVLMADPSKELGLSWVYL